MKLIKNILLGVAGLFLLCACNNENEDLYSVPPTQMMNDYHIRTQAGRTIVISGDLKDKDGLKELNMSNAELGIDTTINFVNNYPDSTLYTYNLEYDYKLSTDLTGGPFTINFLTTDLSGESSKAEVILSLDGDFTPPEFKTLPEEFNTSCMTKTPINFNFVVTDNMDLGMLLIDIPDLNYSESFNISGAEYIFSKTIYLSDVENIDASYDINLTLVDAQGQETTATSKLNITATLNFDKMYITEFTTDEELISDVLGVPQAVKHTGDFKYHAEFYTQQANTIVRFTPDKTTFSNYCFGPSNVDNSKLTNKYDETDGFNLEKANTYYSIDLNLMTLEYNVEEFIPDAEPLPIGEETWINENDHSMGTRIYEMGIIGWGFPAKYACNTTKNPIVLTQDANNPFFLYAEVDLTKGDNISFIYDQKSSKGWWYKPFFRWDNADDPEANVMNGGINMISCEIKATGTYRFEFDTYLLRSRVYKIN